MTGLEVINAAQDAILTIVVVFAPLMIVGIAVGVAVSLFQALTQIQELTLGFVPKILATFAAILIALPFMAETMNNQFLRTITQIIARNN